MLGIIFDCDGTLIDSEHAHFLSWKRAVNKRGVLFEKEDYFPFAGNTGGYISQKLHEKSNLDSPEALYLDKHEAYAEYHKEGISPIERTVRFLRALIAQKEKLGIKLAVASAAPKEEILNNLEHLQLPDVFDAIVSGKEDLAHIRDPEGANKPKPYIYLHTAELLGLEPEQCVALEDSRAGVLAATGAGLVTFAVPNAFTLQHDLSEATFRVEPSEEIEVEAFFQKVRHSLASRK